MSQIEKRKPITEVANILKEYCKNYKKYTLMTEPLYRSYDVSGWITIHTKSVYIRIQYSFDKNDGELLFYEDSKYTPLFRIINILSYDKEKIFEQIDDVLFKFISSKLETKRKTVFNDLLFKICDKYCSDQQYSDKDHSDKKCSDKKRKLDEISDKEDDTFAEFLKQYMTKTSNDELWIK